MTQIGPEKNIGKVDLGQQASKAAKSAKAETTAAPGSANTTNSTQAANLAGQILTQANVDGAIHRENETSDAGAFQGLDPMVSKALSSRTVAKPTNFAEAVFGSTVEAFEQAGRTKLGSWASNVA